MCVFVCACKERQEKVKTSESISFKKYITIRNI